MARFEIWSNPQLPLWQRVSLVLQQMPITQFLMLHQKAQVAFHNLCTEHTPPTGIDSLLWNGLKFCLEQPVPKPNLDNTISRLTKDIRLKHFWLNKPNNDQDYNPKLYIPSNWDPPTANPQIEHAIEAFHADLTTQIRQNKQQQQRSHNLLPSSRRAIQDLKHNTTFIVLPTDKNLGPAILERHIYKKRCLQDHLLDKTTYKQLPHETADGLLYLATKKMSHLITKYGDSLSDAEKTYFQRCSEETRRLPQFYCTPKVHKKPMWKTRPIVSCVNSRMGDLSKWVDTQLQRVIPLCRTHLKDSRTFLTRLQTLGTLPPTARILTADAVSMYTNINTTHALSTLKAWLELHQSELPTHFPTDMILESTALVMHNNIFQFDDTYWLQLTGTAMGSSLAVTYATIYYAYHEETTILPTLQDSLILYGRLIDDAGIIIDTAKLPPPTTEATLPTYLTNLLQFGDLQWEVDPPGRTINFLDLTVDLLPDGRIKTRTFIKPMNLHLYIPPKSAHPPGVLKSLIYGNVQRFWIQNSDTQDYINTTKAFFGHLINRGYTHTELKPIFEEAAQAIDDSHKNHLRRKPKTSSNTFFVHWEYHPRDIPRRSIRQAFNQHLSPILQTAGLPCQPTIAYSVPKNLSRCITKTQLNEPPGQRVSSFITEQPTDNDTSQPLT